MKKHPVLVGFGIVTGIGLSICQVLHLPWTVILCVEQVQMGWGFATHLEMAVLYPWLVELLSLPGVLCGVVFLGICLFRRPGKGIVLTNGILLGTLLLQWTLTNLFIWF